MAKNDSKTRAFATNAKPQKKKTNLRSKKRIRHQVVISIFAVIALILIVFATLIIGKIITTKQPTNEPDITPDVKTVPREESAIHTGNLILINTQYPFDYAKNGLNGSSYSNPPEGIQNLWEFKNNVDNDDKTKIDIGNGTLVPTYELGKLATSICLEKDTLTSFNQMLLDYCKTLDLSSYSSGSASQLNVAWGWSNETELNKDINDSNYGATYTNQADGRTITLTDINSQKITESILKSNFRWIYDHAHEYGFIIRFPNACKDHTGLDSETRVHLRYIGVEHATYIHENNLCLEEYLELIRTKHTINNPLVIKLGDSTYNVYYVEYSAEPTSIPVPKDEDSYISGDNMNGFIITVAK